MMREGLVSELCELLMPLGYTPWDSNNRNRNTFLCLSDITHLVIQR